LQDKRVKILKKNFRLPLKYQLRKLVNIGKKNRGLCEKAIFYRKNYFFTTFVAGFADYFRLKDFKKLLFCKKIFFGANRLDSLPIRLEANNEKC
jgi:hypothetical protein